MDPATFAAAVASLMLVEALKEGGKEMWRGTFSSTQRLVTAIRDKFKDNSVEGVLIDFEKEPTEETKAFLQQYLAKYLKNDNEFAQKVGILMKEIQPNEGNNPSQKIQNMTLSNINAKSGNSSPINIGIQS